MPTAMSQRNVGLMYISGVGFQPAFHSLTHGRQDVYSTWFWL